ncbi:hypothetical protein ACFXDE_34355 [Kitasatospora sp. NPDC059408]|uniref:hypothetical protein n=1 Tax=Kitasatospora sp. NPDC059408 TaxID=3346823 RepID=UPI00368274AF
MNVRKRCTTLAVTLGLATLGLTVPAPAASAAERNYEVVVCSDHAYFGQYANVGGYNQYNQYVHTPNFRLVPCGHQPHWWFKPNQTVEINAQNVSTGEWERHFMKLSNCWHSSRSQLGCNLPY